MNISTRKRRNQQHLGNWVWAVACVFLLVPAWCSCFLIPQSKYYHGTKCTKSRMNRRLSLKVIKDPSTIEQTQTTLEESLKELNSCESGTTARKILGACLGKKEKSLYNSVSIPPGASERPISDAELAIQTNIRNNKYSVMELIELNGDRDADRASLAVLSLTVASSGSALVANQNLPGPEILRFLVVWMFSFAPLAFVGYGIATPDQLQGLLLNIQRNVFPSYRKRMIQHEAGHFLLGHLLGFPIKGYRANAVRNAVEFYSLGDPQVGRDRAKMLGFDDVSSEDLKQTDETDVKDQPYFSESGRGGDTVAKQSVFREGKNYRDNPFLKLPSQNEPTTAWPYRGFDFETIDKLALISVAGVCSEILAYGNAEGGYADLSQLRQIFNSAGDELTEGEMDNKIRFAIGYTMSLLRQNLGALDCLAAVMERDGTVAECVLALETCSNVSGADGILEDYEIRRRASFQSEGFIENLLLRGAKSIDDEDKDVIYGKGGGDRRKRFQLSGDDPFYAALALAGCFFLWANAGGLTLH